MSISILDDNPISINTLSSWLKNQNKIELDRLIIQKIIESRKYLNAKLDSDKTPHYGINTGFGSLYKVRINNENLSQLQENLVMSHACGMGNKVPLEIVKLMLVLKIKSLSHGYSGVQLETVERLLAFYNNNIFPLIFTQGSLGASGDLAPLAHLSLPLLGKGKVYFDGKEQEAKNVLEQHQWHPLKLQSKEGLALLNGTQFMSAYGCYLIMQSRKLMKLATLIGTISLEAFDGRKEPFDSLIHQIRPHKGQIEVAQNVSDFLKGSQLINQPKEHVQDPYSFRCIPQVHGATWDCIEQVAQTFEIEINSVTDNPNIFKEEDKIISGGNFHGQPLALAFDFLKIGMAELGNISERRTYQLVSGLRGLPDFLVENPGLNSGFMIPQYTAASIVSANKQLASPASVDSIVSSNGQEDHVSMGANAAVQALELIQNVKRILAIELMTASQAISFRKNLKSSPYIESFLKDFRQQVPFVSEDVVLHNYMLKAESFIEAWEE